MKDSSTINEAIDLLECAGWKGYAQAVRDLVAEANAHRTEANIQRERNRELDSAIKRLKARRK